MKHVKCAPQQDKKKKLPYENKNKCQIQFVSGAQQKKKVNAIILSLRVLCGAHCFEHFHVVLLVFIFARVQLSVRLSRKTVGSECVALFDCLVDKCMR